MSSGKVDHQIPKRIALQTAGEADLFHGGGAALPHGEFLAFHERGGVAGIGAEALVGLPLVHAAHRVQGQGALAKISNQFFTQLQGVRAEWMWLVHGFQNRLGSCRLQEGEVHAGEAMGMGGFGIQLVRQPGGGQRVGEISLRDEVAGLFMANGRGALEARGILAAMVLMAQMLPAERDGEQHNDAGGGGERSVAADGQAELAEAPGVFGARCVARLPRGHIALQRLHGGIALCGVALQRLHRHGGEGFGHAAFRAVDEHGGVGFVGEFGEGGDLAGLYFFQHLGPAAGEGGAQGEDVI